MHARLYLPVLSFLFLVVAPPYSGASEPFSRLPLFQDGRAVSRIVAPEGASALEDLAIRKLTQGVRDLWGFDLPVVKPGAHPELHRSLVIGTPVSNPVIARAAGAFRSELDRLGPEGFLLKKVEEPRGTYLALASTGPLGVLHGAEYLANFSLQEQAGVVSARTETVSRKPVFAMRGTYNLACWGLAPRYSLEDWEKVIDAMADDGMNVIFFWLSGLFRSQAFPETFIYPETPLTTEDIRRLIRHAHSRGVDFYLGSGVFAWFGVDEIAKHHAEVRELGIQHMCRTLPAAHKAMQAYLMELYDTFPEARGMWLEIGCEGDYHCTGQLCQRSIDEFGSRQIGMSELSFLKQFSSDLWKKHPQAKLVWGMGYPEAHKWDVKYYDEIRRSFTDPRYFFLEVRQNWAMQDAQGVLKPLRELSPHTMHWDQYYALSPRDLGDRARRIQEDGLAGWIVAFEPGFSTHSIYGRRIPYPVDVIPYRLTRFSYREYSFDPAQPWTSFRGKLLEHFFGEGASPELVDLTLTVFELMRTGPIRGSYAELVKPVDGAGYGPMLKPRLAAIEGRLSALEPGLGARGRKLGLPLLRRAIADMREVYSVR